MGSEAVGGVPTECEPPGEGIVTVTPPPTTVILVGSWRTGEEPCVVPCVPAPVPCVPAPGPWVPVPVPEVVEVDVVEVVDELLPLAVVLVVVLGGSYSLHLNGNVFTMTLVLLGN